MKASPAGPRQTTGNWASRSRAVQEESVRANGDGLRSSTIPATLYHSSDPSPNPAAPAAQLDVGPPMICSIPEPGNSELLTSGGQEFGSTGKGWPGSSLVSERELERGWPFTVSKDMSCENTNGA